MKVLWVLVLALLFFPVLGLVAQFAGNLPLAALAYERSPSWIISAAEAERVAFEANAQTELMKSHVQIQAGYLQVRLTRVEKIEEWQKAALATINELTRLLPGNPPLPIIETRKLYDNYGRMDNLFTLAVDPDGDQPIRTMAHELTHLYLLWALIPGFPVDCPRWFNEGLAELVSGKLAGDNKGWSKVALINLRYLVPLYVVSPAFSWSGWHVEWHARDAVSLLLEKEGEEVFRMLIRGLRFARPFHSVFPIVTGRTLDCFEKDWLEQMQKRRVLENLSPGEIASRTLWIAENGGIVELNSLLAGISENLLTKEQLTRLRGVAGLCEARRSFANGDLNDAFGRLHRLDRKIPGYHDFYEDLTKAVRKDLRSRKENSRIAVAANSAAELTSESVSELASKSAVKLPAEAFSWLKRLHWLLAWFVAFLFAGLTVGLYSLMRARLLPLLIAGWKGVTSRNLLFRWLVVGATGLCGSWFLRFLVISMLPYSGLAAITDLNRILLSEILVIFLWLGLAWQLKCWESRTTEREKPVVITGPKIAGDFLFLIIIASIPPLAAAWQNGWQRIDFPLIQIALSVLVLIAGAGAFSIAVWSAVVSWNSRYGEKNHYCPALIYALFRGGLAADPWGSLFAFMVGYRLSQIATSSKKILPSFIADVAFMLPALLLYVGWFPAVDPVAGIWYGGASPVIWWLLPTLILYRWPLMLNLKR